MAVLNILSQGILRTHFIPQMNRFNLSLRATACPREIGGWWGGGALEGDDLLTGAGRGAGGCIGG